MRKTSRSTMFRFFFPLIILSSMNSIFASNCNQTCGSATVPYPFGFSLGCRIQLNCPSDHTISIAEFPVLKLTSASIFLNVSPSCTRELSSASKFFSKNFALKRSNGLFLRSCNSSSFTNCSISTSLISNRLDILPCGSSSNDKVSCFAHVPKEGDGNFIAKEDILTTECGLLYSSVAYKAEQSLTALIFSEVELGWWLDGNCNCSVHANCTKVISPVANTTGYTCECNEGFVGDGFISGRGCSKVPRKRKAGLLAGVITGGASITLIASFLLIYCIRNRRSSSKTLKTTKRLLSESSFNVPIYPYKTIERATSNFSDTHRLGTGAYGTVYSGTLTNKTLIAVKKIKHPDPESVSQVMNEVKMISSVNHPNLVHLLGCCIDRGQQILVYEFMPNGTLSEHLHRQRGGPPLPWTVRLSIASQTAKALAYLHSQVHPPIYHRDIKSSNILLDFQFNPKIADFGLSREVMGDCSHVSTAPQGTPGYVDPQYHQNYHLSDKSDVYSFGVVLMEMVTAMRVVDFNRGQSEVNLAALAVDRIAKGRMEEIVDPFLNVREDGWAFGSVCKVGELAFRCLAFHRDMRPSMVEVADELEGIRVSVWAPKDGEVEVCSSPLTGKDGRSKRVVFVSGRMEEVEVSSSPLIGRDGRSKRAVFVSGRMEEEKVNSPVSVQDNWKSEDSTPSSSSLLGYQNR